MKERAYSSHGETITSLPVSIPLSTVQPNKLPVSIPLASVVLPSRADRAVSVLGHMVVVMVVVALAVVGLQAPLQSLCLCRMLLSLSMWSPVDCRGSIRS